MTINKEQHDAAMILHLSGRLDTTTAPELESEISALPETVKDLTIDMSEVSYISSAGLRVLLVAQKTMSKVGTMTVTGVCAAVREVLDITGFSDILTIV